MHRILPKFKSLSTITLFTSLMIVILVVLSIFKNNTAVLNPTFTTPANATLVMEIHPMNVAPSLLDDLLFVGKGNDLVKSFRNKEDGERMRSYGIDPIQPMTYFTFQDNNKELQGLIMHIVDKDDWNKNINLLFGNTSYAKRVGEFGMVVQSKTFSRNELIEFIDRHQREPKAKLKNAPKHLLQLKYQQKEVLVDAKIDATSNTINSTTVIASKSETTFGQLDYILGPSAFHFSTDLITSEINDSLDQLLSTNLFKKAKLSGLSMNYRGIALYEKSLQPDMDLILTFENPLSHDSVLTLIPNLNAKEKEVFSLGNKNYLIKNIDDRNILISSHNEPSFKENKRFVGIRAIGNPKYLVKIEAGKMVMLFLKMNKIYSLTESFSSSIKAIDIQSNLLSDKSFQIESILNVDKNQNALLQLITVVVESQR